jgi:hypothetical protein
MSGDHQAHDNNDSCDAAIYTDETTPCIGGAFSQIHSIIDCPPLCETQHDTTACGRRFEPDFFSSPTGATTIPDAPTHVPQGPSSSQITRKPTLKTRCDGG